MVKIQYGSIQIGSVTSSSGIFSGVNQQFGFKNTSKEKQAFGHVNGKKNFIANNRSFLDDKDQLDTSSIGKSKDDNV